MLKRLAIVPFEMAIAFYAIMVGLTSLLHLGSVDPMISVLPAWEALVLNAAAMFSGSLMVLGVGVGSSRTELSGLMFLDALIISRFFLLGHYLHFHTPFLVTGMFSVAILTASVVRSLTILRRHVIMRVNETQLITDLGDE